MMLRAKEINALSVRKIRLRRLKDYKNSFEHGYVQDLFFLKDGKSNHSAFLTK